ncbi:MAG: hypothetical protein QM392_03160 [Bacillota bacterium]|mgnify:CR=1 FL=1|jgi:ABC-2 type transport system permease protein|nr:hypothetical protein [Bacillota bacterium]
MRNRLWSVYLSLLNMQYGVSVLRHRYLKERRRLWELLLLTVTLIPFGVIMFRFFWSMAEMLFVGGLGLGQPHVALVYGAVMASLITLFFGFLSVLSAFYFSTDLELLVTLPLSSTEILLVKFAVVLTGKYAINLLILLPFWLRYGILAKAGVGYVISAVLVFLLLPVIPLLIASVIMVLLMRVVNLSRHRDKLTLIGGLLVVGLSIGFQVWLSTNVGEGDPQQMLELLLSQTEGLVRAVGRVFPTAIWAARAMAQAHTLQGWLNFGLLAGASLLGLGALMFIGKRVFLASILQGFEASKGSARKRRAKGTVKSRPVLGTLSLLEVRLFLRDPNYALNGLVGYVMFPILFAVSLFTQEFTGSPLELLATLELPSMFIFGVIVLYVTAMVAMSMIPSTTFSREGKYLWFVRSLPLKLEEVILSRALAAAGVNLVGCLVGVLPMAYLARWQWGSVLLGVLLGALLSLVWAVSLILWDLRRPMLDWVNPIRAVKSNLNAVVGLAASMVLVGALGVISFRLSQGSSAWLVPVLLGLVGLALAAVNYYVLQRFGRKQWRQIEGGM